MGHPSYWKGKKLSKEHRKKLSESHKGIKLSEETKSRMSVSRKGGNNCNYGKCFSKETRKKLSESHKGQIPWNKGKCWSEDIRKKLSEGQRKRNQKGERCSAWKGGLTSLTRGIRHCFEYRQWRSDVFTRDDFTCQKCGRRGGDLEAHHYPKKFSKILKDYRIKILEQALACEELWNINNGRTLCKKCHRG